MLSPVLFTIVLSVLVHVASADVVVFVHGLAGFGPQELFGLDYWGFTKIFPNQDYLQTVRNHGHQVFYASVGPISSNWDRACELYAQIMGTKVDYGKAHSAKYGHARYGTDYTGKGFYPKWSGTNRIHFVGHSMGGNTIRMLEYLLQNGDASEVAATGAATSPLFQKTKTGGNTWIQSMFTISTPHDGSTLHTKLGGNLIDFLKNLISVFAGVDGLTSNDVEWGYNFDLNQFNLGRQNGEGFWTYFNRIFSSSVFQNNFKDLASWDLSPQACREFNAKTKLAYPNTYYFSASTDTTTGCFINDQCATLHTEALLAGTANLIGNMDGVCDSGGYCFDNSWEASDGLVPVRSSQSPQVNIPNYVAPLQWSTTATSFPKGRWQTKSYSRDHVQIIGFRFNPLAWNSADGLYDLIGSTIDKIKVSASTDNIAGDIEAVPSEDTPNVAVIAGSVGGVVGVVGLLALAVVQVRRRRASSNNTTTTLSSFSSSPTNGKGSGRFSRKEMARGSITVQTNLASENPTFELSREAASNNVAVADVARDTIAVATRFDIA